ncbi:MAG: PAS domain-containing sensor histidine kinase [Hyphomicrobiales bacterium]
MHIKSYRIQLAARVLVLVIVVALLLFAFNQERWYVTTASLFVIVVLLFIEVIRFHERYVNKWIHLLDAIRARDFSYNFKHSKKKTGINEFENTLDLLMSDFQQLRIEKEAHYRYVLTILEHIEIATICYDNEGMVHMSNKEMRNLVGLSELNHIRKLSYKNEQLPNILLSLNQNERKQIKLKVNKSINHYTVTATQFTIQNKAYKLVSFYNITTELENNELESFQKLIRVLTHEIMNSVTPITSLSHALNEIISSCQENDCKLETEDIEDLKIGLKIIEKRSKSLSHFVKDYKRLTKIPEPNINNVIAFNLFQHVSVLMKEELQKKNITLELNVSNPDKILQIDQDQVIQVIINMIINACDALIDVNAPTITIFSFSSVDKHIISIKDNGQGMDKETVDNIFIPFFTTKDHGSGIGLNLSRQIIKNHKGSISVFSQPNIGTEFIIEL